MSAECLLHGFVRQHFHYVEDWNIVPLDIIALCNAYFVTPMNIFTICSNQLGKHQSLNRLVCIQMQEKKCIPFNVRMHALQTVEDQEILYLDSDDDDDADDCKSDCNAYDATLHEDWNTIKSGYCFASNIRMSSSRWSNCAQLSALKHVASPLCGIFKCGGRRSNTFERVNDVSLIFFSEKDLHSRKRYANGIDAYQVSLPQTPIAATVECLYSHHYGLFNVYDGTKTVYRLPMAESGEGQADWQWIQMANMNGPHYKGSMCMVNGSVYDEKLFICGGYGADGNKCEILDVRRNEWMTAANLLYKASQSGVKYCFRTHRVYIGGGSRTYSQHKDASRFCSMYDAHKNRWFKLPDTNYEHCHHPLLFIADESPNVIVITGNDQHDIGLSECLDLREHVKPQKTVKWHIVDQHRQLSQYIQIDTDALIRRLCV